MACSSCRRRRCRRRRRRRSPLCFYISNVGLQGVGTAHVFQIVNFEKEKTREIVTLLHSFCILHDSWWNEGVYSVPQLFVFKRAFIPRNIESVVVFQLFFTG